MKFHEWMDLCIHHWQILIKIVRYWLITWYYNKSNINHSVNIDFVTLDWLPAAETFKWPIKSQPVNGHEWSRPNNDHKSVSKFRTTWCYSQETHESVEWRQSCGYCQQEGDLANNLLNWSQGDTHHFSDGFQSILQPLQPPTCRISVQIPKPIHESSNMGHFNG